MSQPVRYYNLSLQDRETLVASLMKSRTIIAPVAKDREFVFDRITEPSQIRWEYTRTILPPKKFLFPPKENLIRFHLNEERVHVEPVLETEETVLLALHPCDIHAIKQLDWIFQDEQDDPNYIERRRHCLIVGIDCQPDEFCLCDSVGTSEAHDGFDLFLHRTQRGYLAEIGTENGRSALLEAMPAAEPSKRQRYRADPKTCPVHLDVDVNSLPLLLSMAYDSPVWEEWGTRCFACGSCNLVCPTCYCFDVLDRMDLTLSEGTRERHWDGCLLDDFAKVASGENFRSKRGARIRHNYYRKFKYLMQKYGQSHCVGCGRCSRACPAKIYRHSVVNDIVNWAQKNRSASYRPVALGTSSEPEE
ncbi:MAG: 4Fe-4S dicluster domain-containing protein [bacterium]